MWSTSLREGQDPYSGYRCSCHSGWPVSHHWSLPWYRLMDCLWHRQPFPLLQHQHYFVLIWEETNPGVFLPFMHLRGEILHLPFWEYCMEYLECLPKSQWGLHLQTLHHPFFICWKDSLFYCMTKLPVAVQNVTTAEGWGWTKDGNHHSLMPVWITIPEAARACSELIKCDVTLIEDVLVASALQSLICKCIKAGLSCTDLCTCNCEVYAVWCF